MFSVQIANFKIQVSKDVLSAVRMSETAGKLFTSNA